MTPQCPTAVKRFTKHAEVDWSGRKEEGARWMAYHSISIAFLSLFGGNGSFPHICMLARLWGWGLHQQSVLLPAARHELCPVGCRLLEDLLSLLFMRQCLKPLQRNLEDTKQSDSLPAKMCKHEQIWAPHGEHQSQEALSPMQHPIAAGGLKCERVLPYAHLTEDEGIIALMPVWYAALHRDKRNGHAILSIPVDTHAVLLSEPCTLQTCSSCLPTLLWLAWRCKGADLNLQVDNQFDASCTESLCKEGLPEKTELRFVFQKDMTSYSLRMLCFCYIAWIFQGRFHWYSAVDFGEVMLSNKQAVSH